MIHVRSITTPFNGNQAAQPHFILNVSNPAPYHVHLFFLMNVRSYRLQHWTGLCACSVDTVTDLPAFQEFSRMAGQVPIHPMPSDFEIAMQDIFAIGAWQCNDNTIQDFGRDGGIHLLHSCAATLYSSPDPIPTQSIHYGKTFRADCAPHLSVKELPPSFLFLPASLGQSNGKLYRDLTWQIANCLRLANGTMPSFNNRGLPRFFSTCLSILGQASAMNDVRNPCFWR